MADAEQIASSTKATFMKKVGPAPVWVYAALGMGVLFVVSRRKRKTVASSAATQDGTSNPAVMDTWMPSTVGMSQGYGGGAVNTDETTPDVQNIYTNNDWVIAGARKLTDPDSAATLRRLRQYVGGAVLPQGEYDATIDTANRATAALKSPPPEPFAFPRVAPTTGVTAQPNPAPPAAQVNNGKPKVFTLQDFGGSMEGAAERLYGDPTAWWKFRVYDPNGDPNTGWITKESYNQIATGQLPPDIKLVANPEGRISD